MSRPAPTAPPSAPPADHPAAKYAELDDDQLLEALTLAGIEFDGDRDAAINALAALESEADSFEPKPEPEPEWTIGEGKHVGTLWASKPFGEPAFNRECSCGDFDGTPVSTVEQADEDFADHL